MIAGIPSLSGIRAGVIEPSSLALTLRSCSIMVRTLLFAGLILAGAATTPSEQSGSPSRQTPPPLVQKTITLVGCVKPDASKPEWFTLSDQKTGAIYRLTGASIRSYVWRNVRIVGGLVPSANIAAQAGAIDQTKAAMAYQGASRPGTGNLEPIEFSVTCVRRLTGSCTPKPIR